MVVVELVSGREFYLIDIIYLACFLNFPIVLRILAYKKNLHKNYERRLNHENSYKQQKQYCKKYSNYFFYLSAETIGTF